jgi:hypothetical protein
MTLVDRDAGGPADQPAVGDIRVARLARTVAARLDTAPLVMGRIHSVFTRCVNVECRDGRIVAFHAPGPLAAPFAASLSVVPDLGAVRAGDLVRRRGDRLRLGPLEVSFTPAARVDLSMPRGARPARHVAEALAALGALAGAAALDLPQARQARARLAEAIRAGDPDGFAAAGRALLGLGEGLTPAGDDCVVGALAVLAGSERQFLTPRARTSLARDAVERTTAIGREFILHALEGAFAEPVLALFAATTAAEAERAAAGLARTGATSGVDTLAGVRLAVEAMEARRT